MNNFTPISTINQLPLLGGVALGATPPAQPSAATLSKAHICPQGQIKFWLGGTRLTVEKPKYSYQGKHTYGGRSEITEFSRASRRRLMYKLAEISCKVLPLFLTLTYPEKFTTDPKQWKADLNKLWKRIKRRFPDAGCIWKLEPQKRGAPHFHLLVWGCTWTGLFKYVPENWYEIAGGGDKNHLLWHMGMLRNGNQPCVTVVKSWRGVMSYASKYMGKVCNSDGWDSPGRFWGAKSRACIPWASMVRVSITQKGGAQFIRLMRRYAHMNTGALQSLTIFCNNPEFWFDHVDRMCSPP